MSCDQLIIISLSSSRQVAADDSNCAAAAAAAAAAAETASQCRQRVAAAFGFKPSPHLQYSCDRFETAAGK